VTHPTIDDLVAWSVDEKGRLAGFEGARGLCRFSAFTRFLLPGLDEGFAEPGDLLRMVRVPWLRAHIAAITNVSRRTSIGAPPSRRVLFFLTIAALPLPAALAWDLWWLLIAVELAGAAATLFLILARLDAEAAAEERAAYGIAFRWRLLRRHIAPDAAPPPTPPPAPEPDWMERLSQSHDRSLAGCDWRQVAALPVEDGRLVACEPYHIDEWAKYCVDVPPGTYQVVLAIAHFGPADSPLHDERVAHAWVQVGEGEVARWEPARNPEGAEMGFGVDSGIAAFTSVAAAGPIVAHFDHGDRYGFVMPLNDAILAKMELRMRPTRGWGAIDVGEARLVAFSSGWGDGYYPVYRGLDEAGALVAVAIDFHVEPDDWR
jgi:hypothetical protein